MEDEIDPAFVKAVLQQATSSARELSVLYTPLHGVGATAVCPVLQAAGFQDVRLYAPQAEPDGDSQCSGACCQSRKSRSAYGAIEEARTRSDDVVMASDPDVIVSAPPRHQDRRRIANGEHSQASTWCFVG